MVLISAEPVIFLYMFCYSAMILLGQDFILERLCLQRLNSRSCSTPKGLPLNNTLLLESNEDAFLGNNFTPFMMDGKKNYVIDEDETRSQQKEIKAEAVKLYMVVTATNAVSSVAASQVLGYWMDRISRKVLMTAPVGGGVLWALTYALVGYFESSPIELLFLGVSLGGLSGGYVTLKTAVTSYIIQETPPDLRTVRLSVVEASIFLGAAASLFSMYLTTTYLTTNYCYIFLGVEGGFILAFLYIFCILRDDLHIEYPHLSYSYDDLDGPRVRSASHQSYGSIQNVSRRRHQRQRVSDVNVHPPEKLSEGENTGSQCCIAEAVPTIQIEECSTPSGSATTKSDSRRQVFGEADSVSESPSFDVSDSDTTKAIHDQDDTLDAPAANAETVSIKSVYGTPPLIVVTEEDSSSIGDSPERRKVIPALGQILAIPYARAEAGSSHSIYGTPPDQFMTHNDADSKTNTASFLSETGTGSSDHIKDSSDHNIERDDDDDDDDNTNDLNRSRSNANSGSDTVDDGPSEEQDITDNNQSILDRATTPSLRASLMTISSHIETGNPQKFIAEGTIGRCHKYHSNYASDGILNFKEYRNNTFFVRKTLEMPVRNKGSAEESVFDEQADFIFKSASTPDSLNNRWFPDQDNHSENSLRSDSPDGLHSSDIKKRKRKSSSSETPNDETRDSVDGGSNNSCCGSIIRSISDAITTTFRRRDGGLRSMIVAVVVANFFVSFIVVAEQDNVFLYLNSKFNWNFSRCAVYYATKSAVDGVALLFVLPILQRCLGFKDATLGVLGGLSRSAFFIMLGLISTSKQVFEVPFVGFFGQYLFVAERAIMSSLVEEDEQGRVFTVLCSVDQLALMAGAFFYDNLFSYFLKRTMPGVTLLIAGFMALIPTVIFGALYFSMNARQQPTDEHDSSEERRPLLRSQRLMNNGSLNSSYSA